MLLYITMPILIESVHDVFTWLLLYIFTKFSINMDELLGWVVSIICSLFWLSAHPQIWITFINKLKKLMEDNNLYNLYLVSKIYIY